MRSCIDELVRADSSEHYCSINLIIMIFKFSSAPEPLVISFTEAGFHAAARSEDRTGIRPELKTISSKLRS